MSLSAVISATEKAAEWETAVGLLHQAGVGHMAGGFSNHPTRLTVSLEAPKLDLDFASCWMRPCLGSVMFLVKLCFEDMEDESARFSSTQALTSWSLDVNSVTFAAAISACEKAGEWQMACALLRQLSRA